MKSLLFFLVGLTGIISLMGGLQMIHSPNGEVLNMSLIPLEQTPFKNFLIPGLFLAIVVGGVSFVALVLQIQLHPARFNWAIAAGILLSFWIIVQIFFFRAVALVALHLSVHKSSYHLCSHKAKRNNTEHEKVVRHIQDPP
jgi:hypothetical protein